LANESELQRVKVEKMAGTDDRELLFDLPLAIDQIDIQRSDAAIVLDKRIALLMRENRIALARGKSALLQSVRGHRPRILDVTLICTAHSHPECRFHWVRLVVDLKPTPGASIHDMAPREILGDKPVEISTKVGLDMKLEIASKIVITAGGPAFSRTSSVFVPRLLSSGINLSIGYWDFLALDGSYLHVDHDLRILIRTSDEMPIRARFNLQAHVSMAGIAGLIPLLGRGADVERVYTLSSLPA
jgi:hypothetical protein